MLSLRQLSQLRLIGVPVMAFGNDRAPRPAPSTAVVEGRVDISRALTTRRPRCRIYAEPGVGATPRAPDPHQDEWRNIVVYVDRVPAAEGSVRADRAMLRQHDERFSPHVLPIVRGTTVEFPNDDALFPDVFSLWRAKEFDLGRYQRGESRSITFERPGMVQVFCHVHSDMNAVVLVVDNGYFAVPDSSGRYSIQDLPPSEYTLVAWHERIRPITHRLRVEPGQLARVDFTIPLPAANAAHER